MSNNSKFIIKNGLTIELYNVISANGVWVGDTTNIKGPNGAQGPQGSSGVPGNPGPEGFQGPQGGDGPEGFQGTIGAQGPQGGTGPTGFQGPQGGSGPSGVQGTIGAQGPAGGTGAAGRQGSQGTPGPVGGTGPAGRQGPQGATGPTGTPATLSSLVPALGVGTAAGPTGTIRATNNITAYYSDIRLKDNIESIKNAGEKLYKLNGLFYTQNELAEKFGYHDYSTQIGVLAQEVEKVVPEAIYPAPFDVDENGNSTSGENYLTVQYEKLIPLIIETIKEQQKEIENLNWMINHGN